MWAGCPIATVAGPRMNGRNEAGLPADAAVTKKHSRSAAAPQARAGVEDFMVPGLIDDNFTWDW